MANLRANASTGHLRVYGTSLSDDGALPREEREQDTSLLLRKIELHRDEAVKLLASHPDLLRFLDAATSVGLLDPVSNIVVSAMLAAAADPVDGASALVGVDKDMKQRSLDGLVAFLTCFFPHLIDWEAVRYLVLAQADPLVAARIVVEDRRTKCFRPGSAATNGALKLALKCAMVAAKHPCPSELAGVWLSLCSSLDTLEKAVSLLSAVRPNSPGDILHTLAKQMPVVPCPAPDAIGSSLIRPWELAARRSKHAAKVTHQYSWSLRRVLLHTIHGFYLQALARMPGGELRSRYHRSMLKAGHCYGPFDPVTNIIVNTIWYEATFPPLSQLDELDILGTLNLMRIEAQSFYGLVSFLCTHDKDLNADQAIRFLLDTDLNLAATKQCSSVQEEQEAFRAAATAAWHPRPDAQAAFLSSCKTPAVLSLLSDNGGQQQLSSQCVHQLAMLLSPAFRSTGMLAQQKRPVAIYERRFHLTMDEGHIQRRARRRISRKVKAALSRYEVQNSEQACHQLLVVCGVNTYVSGPDESMHSIMMQKKKDPVEDDYYHHTHANFLVTRNVGSVGSVPVLFFAELSNKNDDQDSQLLCCPVEFPLPGAEPVRCLFCEQEGIRIVHPASGEGFHGHQVEFVKMVRGEDLFENVDYPEEYDNDRILTKSEYVTNTVADGFDEDCMYLGSDDFTIKESDGHESDYYGEE
ncbi:hypothetical protein CFC21_075770 [Triticum aestivum]|uniref:Uncharacterized protein n=2 Tax=Triticum aestivum TaxID=4565 RepID=A0A9R1HRN8_WHEAT|nr:uncharacterized protein LOC123124208 [Triticum aestivum]KAF7070234.1 hypothetical protein CFC21_075770 [Triticum aestivum]